MYRVSPFVRRFAWALLGGAGVATVWVNLSPASYYDMIEWRFLEHERLSALPFAQVLPETFLLTPVTLVSDALMALFLFFVGKELWEALVLERGAERPLGIEKNAGPWSLFRFFELMQSEPASGRDSRLLKAELAGMRANFLLTSPRSPDPFQMANWRTFRLPEQL